MKISDYISGRYIGGNIMNSEKKKGFLERFLGFLRSFVNAVKSFFGIGNKSGSQDKEVNIESDIYTNVVSDTFENIGQGDAPPIAGDHSALSTVQELIEISVEDIRNAHANLGDKKADSFKWRVYATLKLYADKSGLPEDNLANEYELNVPGRSGKGAINALCGDRGVKATVKDATTENQARGNIARLLGVSEDEITNDVLEKIGSDDPQIVVGALNEVITQNSSRDLRS